MGRFGDACMVSVGQLYTCWIRVHPRGEKYKCCILEVRLVLVLCMSAD